MPGISISCLQFLFLWNYVGKATPSMMTLQTFARVVKGTPATTVCQMIHPLPMASPIMTWLLKDPLPVAVAVQTLEDLLYGSLLLQIELCMSKSVLLGFHVYVCAYVCMLIRMLSNDNHMAMHYSCFSLYLMQRIHQPTWG